jgi:hypothetical protein
LTEAALERRLRFSLACSTIKWRKLKKPTFAMVTADQGQHHLITLPRGWDDDFTLRALLHELLHVTVPGELGAFGVFEEDILERVLEPRLMDHLLRHPRKQAFWLKALKKAREGTNARGRKTAQSQ